MRSWRQLETHSLNSVAERAQQLLAVGRSLGDGVKVNRANRKCCPVFFITYEQGNRHEIECGRTHGKISCSSLLAKFGVAGRAALSREVALGRMPTNRMAVQVASRTLFGYPVVNQEGRVKNADTPGPPAPVAEAPVGRRKVLPMFANERFAVPKKNSLKMKTAPPWVSAGGAV